MKLESTASFFKFQEKGDKISGTFVSFTAAVPGKFGPEDQLVLSVGGEKTMVRCQKGLARIISQHAAKLPGKTISIEYVSDKDIGKGRAMKVFDVNVEESEVPATHAAPSDLPF